MFTDNEKIENDSLSTNALDVLINSCTHWKISFAESVKRIFWINLNNDVKSICKFFHI